mgnify:FL=1
MKKVFLFLTLAATTVFGLTSCEKLKDSLFEAFEIPYSFEVTIPVVTNTTTELTLGQTAVRFNLDSVIRANTANVFGAEVVGNIQMKELAFEVIDGNASSNLTNFSYVKMEVSSGNSTPVVIGPYNIPSTATSSVSFPVTNSFNIKSMFSGSTVNFKITGKAQKETTQAMKVRINTRLAFDR